MGVCFGVPEKMINNKTVPSILAKEEGKTEKVIRNQHLSDVKRSKCFNPKNFSDEFIARKYSNLKKKSQLRDSGITVSTVNDDFKPVKFLDVNKYIRMIDRIDQKTREIKDIALMQ